MTRHKIHYSLVEMRHDLADPGKRIDMGVIMEFTTPEYWVVGLASRVVFPPEALANVDPIGRELLNSRRSVLESEIVALLGAVKKPGEVLQRLSEANPWSIHVTRPKELTLPKDAAASSASLEKLAEHYVFSIYNKAKEQTKPIEKAAAKVALGVGETRRLVTAKAAVMQPEITPAWMLPPTLWTAPIVKH